MCAPYSTFEHELVARSKRMPLLLLMCSCCCCCCCCCWCCCCCCIAFRCSCCQNGTKILPIKAVVVSVSGQECRSPWVDWLEAKTATPSHSQLRWWWWHRSQSNTQFPPWGEDTVSRSTRFQSESENRQSERLAAFGRMRLMDRCEAAKQKKAKMKWNYQIRDTITARI